MERTSKKGFLMKTLDWIEKIGNKLPHPITLFAIFALLVVVLSAILSAINVQVQDPATGENLEVVNLLSASGVQYMFESMVENFVGFAPLGTVLVTMLGIGVAERSGLISAMLRGLVTSVPQSLLTAALVFAGIMSSMASDAGYVVLTPLGAVLFAGLGRHPLAGLAAAFAGVSAGYSANLFLTSLDPLLADLTIQAAQTIDPAYAESILYTMNYYFMIASVFVLTIVGTLITDKLVEPRLGSFSGSSDDEINYLTNNEKKGLWGALAALIITVGLLSLLILPSWGPLRNPDEFLASPFFQSLVPVILILFFIPGFVYGKMTGAIKNDKDVANQLSETMATMGMYIVLAFTAGQFVAYFNHTNMGKVLAVTGADFLDSIGFTGLGLIVAFIIVAAVINLFIGSSSAKWAIMAPVFVPLMMQLGYSPELTTLAYRIADSTTNIISPLMPYFAIVIAFAQKYDKNVGIGTLIATMLPYSIGFFIIWIIMLFVWMAFGWPIGPGAGFFYQ
ncbi:MULTISPECIES: AbgT family transporter [Salimicrobium]|uniref:Aminobenzoyl-glutamate transport protein n=2 Tax=Salimicrobium TaxID=351195 RepID=A0A1H3DVJ8_9BACI|nr:MULTISPECIES: AbgT family transporter [Salimicrobium]AKG04362.1 aminobenzoyl-glutamate transporter [Salimicrobium jeotgali]EKE31030.1 AbgT putative transporter [Salimicrobium jeotgali]MBM7697469.1 aminobenzoyl-glutamate transport protein [Salimicrobium jeotgali]SDX70562.1 aminobenzoyl-glutamate transport protein [Salimicrobium album]